MRRLLTVTSVVLGLSLAAAGVAQASFHQLRVNEVATQLNGDVTQQFIELWDPFNEPFPAFDAPFTINVFNGAGTQVGGTITVAGSGSGGFMGAPGFAATPYVISSDTAHNAGGIRQDLALPVPLPLTAGQVCYSGGSGGGSTVHCLAYGPINTPHTTGRTTTGSAPGSNQALALRNCTSTTYDDTHAAIAMPTPGAVNSPASGGPVCPQKPTITVLAPSAIANTTATVNADIAPHGENTQFRFHYGTSAGHYTDQSMLGSIAFDAALFHAHGALTGLTPGTTYHYVVAATNHEGTTTSTDHVFKTTGTKPPPPFAADFLIVTGLHTTLVRGLGLHLRSNRSATARVSIRLLSSVASKLGLTNPVGTGKTSVTPPRTSRRFALHHAARTALAAKRKVRFLVTVTFTDHAGHRLVRHHSATLK